MKPGWVAKPKGTPVAEPDIRGMNPKMVAEDLVVLGRLADLRVKTGFRLRETNVADGKMRVTDVNADDPKAVYNEFDADIFDASDSSAHWKVTGRDPVIAAIYACDAFTWTMLAKKPKLREKMANYRILIAAYLEMHDWAILREPGTGEFIGSSDEILRTEGLMDYELGLTPLQPRRE